MSWLEENGNEAQSGRAEAPPSAALERAQFVAAVRDAHQGALSDAAHRARVHLAEEYLATDLPDEAIELLLAAICDAGRLYGPDDDRTFELRSRLGDAYLAAGHLFDAYGAHAHVLAAIEAADGRDSIRAAKARDIADATLLALESEHGRQFPPD